jgi:glycosyl transferase, family 25
MNAVDLTANPALGCSLSHIKCLELAAEQGWEEVLICEDDVMFLNPKLLILQYTSFKQTAEYESADVILLGGNNMAPFQTFDHGLCVQVAHCLTTTCYMVKKRYYATLIANMREASKQLACGAPRNQFAIDKYWLKLQETDTWMLVVPVTVVQYPNYSDIEKRETNFISHMTNHNKAYLPSF